MIDKNSFYYDQWNQGVGVCDGVLNTETLTVTTEGTTAGTHNVNPFSDANNAIDILKEGKMATTKIKKVGNKQEYEVIRPDVLTTLGVPIPDTLMKFVAGIAKKIKKNIVMKCHNSFNANMALNNKENLYLVFHSDIQYNGLIERQDMPTVDVIIERIKIGGKLFSFAPGGQADMTPYKIEGATNINMPVKYSTDIVTRKFGWYSDNIIFIYFDIPHEFNDFAKEFIKFIIKNYAHKLDFKFTPVNLKDIISKYFKNGINKQLEDFKNKQNLCNRDIETYIREMANRVKEVEDINKQIKALISYNTSDKDNHDNITDTIIKNIQSNKFITDFGCDNENLLFFKTKTVVIDKAVIGRFKIIIDILNNKIIFDNLDKYDDRMHPHIERSGDACWGNIGTPVAKLLGAGKFDELINLIINFLHSYNPEDAYETLHHFDDSYGGDKDDERDEDRDEFDD